MLQQKDKVPINIKIEGENGKSVSLKDYLGKYAVLYFYPKDDTPGCTKEACSFRDWNADIKKLGAVIVGVSKDLPDSHQKFTKKYKINFQLWSDKDHKLMDAFGVWQKKKFMGREYFGTIRSTFIIDPKGKIIKVWEKVEPLNHAQEVFEFLKDKISSV